MITFEEAAVAFVNAVLRAQKAETELKILKKQLEEKEEKKK